MLWSAKRRSAWAFDRDGVPVLIEWDGLGFGSGGDGVDHGVTVRRCVAADFGADTFGFCQEVPPIPGGALRGDALAGQGAHGVHPVRREVAGAEGRCPGAPNGVGEHFSGFEALGGRPCAPLGGELVERDGCFRFGGPGGKGCLLSELDGGCRGWGSAVTGGPFGHEPVGFEIDETRAVGEFADQRIVDAGQLLAGVVGVRGRHADVRVGAEVPVEGVEEETVVVLAGSYRSLVQSPRVERDPCAVSDALDAVGDDHVRMELRIPGPRLPVVEGSSDSSTCAEVGDTVAAGPRVDDVSFEPLQGWR